MDQLSPRALKAEAAHTLRRVRDPQKLMLAYCLAAGILSLVATLGSYALSLRIANTGGLGNMGSRAILETLQSLLPYGEFFASIGLNLGLLSAVLRFSRLLYADHTNLTTGFQLFLPGLRLTLLQIGLYVLLGFAASFVATQIFMLTPWAFSFMELAATLPASTLSGTMPVLDEATVAALSNAMIPMFVILMVIYLPAVVFVSYRYRLAHLCLLDDPKHGALAAMRSSRTLLKKKCFALLKLDFSFWWYYLAMAAVAVLGYGELILPLLGVELPISEDAAFFLFYFLMLAGQLGLFYGFRLRVETATAVFYNTIRPKPADNGVVLGNIFDL